MGAKKMVPQLLPPIMSDRPLRSRSTRGVSWTNYRESWDRMQERYIPEREARFSTMLEILEQQFRSPTRILDIGTGLGSLAERMAARWPRVRIVGVDYDPVLLRIARESLGHLHRRIQWVDADLRSPGWDRMLPPGRFDAVVSTTALHWLRPSKLHPLLQTLARRIRRGGLFLNGDHIPFPADLPRIGSILREIRHQAQRRQLRRQPGPTWNAWWALAARDPRLASEIKLRRQRYPREHRDVAHDDVNGWLTSLGRAGFREAAVAWQQWDDRILLAIR
jgi:SAM-dependent methyltransferase